MDKFLLILFTAVTLLIFACRQGKPDQYRSQNNNEPVDNQIITIDTFSTFPPEIDGCSCYFANDSTEFKQGKYIYVNDYAQMSFLTLSGILTKFSQTDFIEIDSLNFRARYKSDDYYMTLDFKDGIQNGDETWLKTGTIKLIDKKGNTITRKFYGECGC